MTPAPPETDSGAGGVNPPGARFELAPPAPHPSEGDIPTGFAGCVQLALDLNVLNAFFFLEPGPFDLQPVVEARFEPLWPVARGEYAVAATRFFHAYLEGTEE